MGKPVSTVQTCSAFTYIVLPFLHLRVDAHACSHLCAWASTVSLVCSHCAHRWAWPHSKIWTRGCLKATLSWRQTPSWAPWNLTFTLATLTGGTAYPRQVGGFRLLVSRSMHPETWIWICFSWYMLKMLFFLFPFFSYLTKRLAWFLNLY